ncbi:MAG: glycosyltransferase family 4 protein [Planctomycetes bacterium]|nr:glycosyltransferase family 4 protein [Planctomycetota bacterium]
MRIARVLTRLNLGGPARQVLASDPLLSARGHAVRIFVGSPESGEGDLFETARARGLDVVRVPGLARGWSLVGDLRARAFLRTALAEFQPDVLHTHASKAGALTRWASGWLGHLPRVHTFHGHVLEGYFHPMVSTGIAALERKLARKTDRIVAVSHATADDLVRLAVAREDQIVVIPPGIDLAPFLALSGGNGVLRSLVRAPEEAQLVGVFGRLAQVKRPEWAIDVFELLASRYPRLQLVFIGDGDQRGMLERRIRALPASCRERVHMLGAVDDVALLYADLCAVVLTSRQEGLPVALIEAAAAAKPVVATRVGGVGEIVAEERTGYLGTSVDELAYGLAQLLESPAEAHAMGQRARMRAQSRHSAQALATRLEQLYQAVVAARSARA